MSRSRLDVRTGVHCERSASVLTRCETLPRGLEISGEAPENAYPCHQPGRPTHPPFRSWGSLPAVSPASRVVPFA